MGNYNQTSAGRVDYSENKRDAVCCSKTKGMCNTDKGARKYRNKAINEG